MASKYISERKAAALIGITPYATRKLPITGRVRVLLKPGEPLKYDLEDVMRIARELNTEATADSDV